VRTRVYWLLPDLPSARATMDDLVQAGVEVRHMHFVAREDCDLSGLHAAGVLETSDVLRCAEAGLVVGAAAGGVLGAFAAVSYPGVDEAPLWGLIPALVVAGALVDAWTSSMFGISAPSKRLQRFQAEIAQGRILLLLDVPLRRAGEIEERLRALHSEARLQGAEADQPAFP